MKTLLIILFAFTTTLLRGQNENTDIDTTKYSRITKHDGSELVGIILKMDAREILLKTKTIGNMVIPKHLIKKIETIEDAEVKTDGDIWPRNLLPSRYTLTTNGIPVKKGEGYLRVMPLGVDCQFPVTDYWSVGGMTSWYGVPIIVTSKLSKSIDDDLHVSAGFLYGNLLHGAAFSGDPFFSYGGGIGFANITLGDEEKNFNISGGYGFVHNPTFMDNVQTIQSNGTAMFSIAAMARAESKITLLFDSVGILVDDNIYYWVNPAVRYMSKPTNIWQFGINVGGRNDLFVPIPFPSVSFTKVFKK